MQSYPTAAAAIDALSERYNRSITALRAALERFVKDGTPPPPAIRATGAFAYPELRLIYAAHGPAPRFERAFARFNTPGTYAVTITRPDMFRPYLLEQLGPLMRDYGAKVQVGTSSREIPYPYVLDGADLALTGTTPEDLARHFPTTHLAHIGDELADGLWDRNWSENTAARAVRCAAHRFLACASSPLHRHAARAHPILYSVHELSSLCR